MKKSILIFLSIILFSSCSSENESKTDFTKTGLPQNFTNRLNFVLDSVCNKLQIKGASCAVLIPNKGIWEGNYGFSHNEVKIRSNMTFTIGSNTKTYISTLMLKLQEKGVLNINDKVSQWLPNVPYLDENITIKQILNHTSGLGDFSYNPNFIQSIKNDFYKVWMPEETFPFFEAPIANPGSIYSYSDQNYLVAGLVIEAATQKPLKVSMRELILKPLGLTNTLYYPFETTNLVFPHSWSADFSNGDFVDLDNLGYARIAFCSADNAAGGMVSNPKENAIFWHNLMTEKIINKSSLQMMFEFNSIGVENNFYGLGIQKSEHSFGNRTIFSHNGYVPGSINDNAYDSQSGVCITILTNQDYYKSLSPIIQVLHKVTMDFE
jgi:D-alanyl-D-alanine carboxypeptidase